MLTLNELANKDDKFAKRINILDNFRLLDHVYYLSKECEYKEELAPLIKAIILTGDKISNIITEKSGLIDNIRTEDYYTYLAHFELLKSSYEVNSSLNEKGNWQKIGYYPRTLNRIVIEGYKDVFNNFENIKQFGDKECSSLIGNYSSTTSIRQFNDMFDNLAYYENNAKEYKARFDNFDLSTQIQIFLDKVQANHKNDTISKIKLLDLGCGTGRDKCRFIRKGYPVKAIDISPSMQRLCSRAIRELQLDQNREVAAAAKNSKCVEQAFDELTERNSYNGIWASASLLHLNRPSIISAFHAIARAALPGGIIYISLKYGKGDADYDSRHYTLFRRRDVIHDLSKIKNLHIDDIWLTNSKACRLSPLQTIFESIKCHLGISSSAWVNIFVHKKY